MGHCKRILVVEDNDDIRDLLVQLLNEEGYEVDSAQNGKEALEKLASRPSDPSLILLDLMMPTMNGWEFIEAKKRTPALAIHRVVTMSAVRPTVSLHDPEPLQTDGAIPKPLFLERVWEIVNKFCGPSRHSLTA